jgi:hypothetical protein
MTFRTPIHCPNCYVSVQEDLADGELFTCPFCESAYRVMTDPERRSIGFVEVRQKEIPEPLGLPRGSIRAGVAVLLVLSALLLILIDEEVPSTHLGLLLAIVGYYFGFRMRMKAGRSRIYDAAAKERQPLFLPEGCVRVFLILGFAVGLVMLWVRGKVGEPAYAEFFVVLAGLVLGYLFSKALSNWRRAALFITLNHLKGFVVIAASIGILILLVSGLYEEHRYVAMVFSALVTFYFGSRS